MYMYNKLLIVQIVVYDCKYDCMHACILLIAVNVLRVRDLQSVVIVV